MNLGTLLAGLALACTSCSSTQVSSLSSPGEAKAAIILAAEAGQQDEADRLFDAFARSEAGRDEAYVALFQAAAARYEVGRTADAVQILQFVTERYPAAYAPREALVYALLLERAQSELSTVGSRTALRNAIESVREMTVTPPIWVELADAQLAVDEDDPGRARRSLDTFRAGWNGAPVELQTYVADLDRHLLSF